MTFVIRTLASSGHNANEPSMTPSAWAKPAERPAATRKAPRSAPSRPVASNDQDACAVRVHLDLDHQLARLGRFGRVSGEGRRPSQLCSRADLGGQPTGRVRLAPPRPCQGVEAVRGCPARAIVERPIQVAFADQV